MDLDKSEQLIRYADCTSYFNGDTVLNKVKEKYGKHEDDYSFYDILIDLKQRQGRVVDDYTNEGIKSRYDNQIVIVSGIFKISITDAELLLADYYRGLNSKEMEICLEATDFSQLALHNNKINRFSYEGARRLVTTKINISDCNSFFVDKNELIKLGGSIYNFERPIPRLLSDAKSEAGSKKNEENRTKGLKLIHQFYSDPNNSNPSKADAIRFIQNKVYKQNSRGENIQIGESTLRKWVDAYLKQS